MPIKRKQRNNQRTSRQFVIFIVVLLFAGGIIGGSVVGTVNALSKSTEKTSLTDEKTLRYEPTYNYLSYNDFTPLDCGLSVELQEYTYYLCKAYGIDFNFTMALMFTESSFKADCISTTDDYGLMQINKCNHEPLSSALGITDFTEPYQNIRAGLYILRQLFEKYDEPALVCMAYNMGEYGASVLWEQGIYETVYSNKVLAKADEYAAQKGAAADER